MRGHSMLLNKSSAFTRKRSALNSKPTDARVICAMVAT